MADREEDLNDETIRISEQMFGEKSLEDYLKHLDGYNEPSTSILEPRQPIWANLLPPLPHLLHIFFPPVRVMTDEVPSEDPSSEHGQPHETENQLWKHAQFFMRTVWMADDEESQKDQAGTSDSQDDILPRRSMSRIDRIRKNLGKQLEKRLSGLNLSPEEKQRLAKDPRESPILRNEHAQSGREDPPKPGSLLTASNLPNRMISESDSSGPSIRGDPVTLLEPTVHSNKSSSEPSSSMGSFMSDTPGLQVTPATSRRGDPPSNEIPGMIELMREKRKENVESQRQRSKKQVDIIREQLEKKKAEANLKEKAEPKVEPAGPGASNEEVPRKKSGVCTIL